MKATEIPVCETFDPAPRPARFTPPPGACDCHAHVFGPLVRYPVVAERSYTPAMASLDEYQHMLATLGLQRGVIVQPSVYGTDNRATLDAVAEGGENFRAVVVVDDSVSATELRAMHAPGARGARVNVLFASDARRDNLKTLASKLADVGWHLQMLIDVSKFPDLYDFVTGLPVPAVFDHFGHMPAELGLENSGFQDMVRLLDEGRCWVKLSGAYRFTAEQRPPYSDIAPFAQTLIATNPDRLVWATDWPHPQIPTPMPNDGALLDMLADWAPDEALRNRILVDNPARLYGFEV